MKRVLAWAGIFVIVALFLLLIILTATGAEANAIMAVLFCLIIFPVILYGCILFYRVTKKDEKKDGKES